MLGAFRTWGWAVKNALVLPLLLLYGRFCVAAESTVGAAAPDFGMSLVRMFFSLLVVLLVVIGGLLVVRHLQQPRGAMAGMKILGAVAVGQRERVVLLEVPDKVLVLGVTSSQVNTLHTLERASLPQTPAQDAAPVRGIEFARLLRRKLDASPTEPQA